MARKRSYDRLPFTREFCVSKDEEERRGDAPLSVVCEDRVRLTECEELLPGLRLFVHIRVELLAQLQGSKKNDSRFFEKDQKVKMSYLRWIGRRVGAIRTL